MLFSQEKTALSAQTGVSGVTYLGRGLRSDGCYQIVGCWRCCGDMDVVAGYYFLVKGRGEGRRSLSVGGSG